MHGLLLIVNDILFHGHRAPLQEAASVQFSKSVFSDSSERFKTCRYITTDLVSTIPQINVVGKNMLLFIYSGVISFSVNPLPNRISHARGYVLFKIS
jgi:hypothetical protein